ncbi:hypothetical protein [Aeromonas caviae]|uniref:hypothetical protein n=1 Tax=Aeromonas caviae TaxID=648 RepID=UPI001FC8343E|nr:hypothetical protein [Aeromonas caviae]
MTMMINKKFIFRLMIISSTLYLSQIMLSPIYFLSLTALFLFLFVCDGIQIKIYDFIFLCSFFSYFVITQATTASFNIIGNLYCFLIINTIVMLTYKAVDRDYINRTILIFFGVSLLIFFADTFWRFANPDYDQIRNLDRLYELGLGYQVYKSNSIMYIDSNNVGVHALCLFMLSVVVNGIKGLNVFRLSFFIIILLTLSRAAVVSAVVGYIFYIVDTSKYRFYFRTSMWLSIIPISYVIIVTLTHYSDESLASKFYLLQSAYNFLSGEYDYPAYSILTGVGFGNAINVIGMGSHSIYVSLLVEAGIVGFVIYFLHLAFFYKKAKATKYIILPFLITSFSLGAVVSPWFFCSLWLVVALNEDEISERKIN